MGRKRQKTRSEKSNPSKKASASAGLKLPRFDRSLWELAGILALLTIITFAGVARCGFITLDDPAYVYGNPHVWKGLTGENVAWAWRNTEGSTWMPLTWMSLQLDVTLSGWKAKRWSTGKKNNAALKKMPARPAPYISCGQSLVACGVGCIAVSINLSHDGEAAGPSAKDDSVLLWAVHPLRVESVAWVAERKDVLAMFWGLLAAFIST